MMMKKIVIPQDLAQELHDYLMTRPMREVEPLVVNLRQCEALPEDAASPPPAKPENE